MVFGDYYSFPSALVALSDFDGSCNDNIPLDGGWDLMVWVLVFEWHTFGGRKVDGYCLAGQFFLWTIRRLVLFSRPAYFGGSRVNTPR